MENTDYQALAECLEHLAAQAAKSLERQMAKPEADARRTKELLGLVRDALGLANELRGQEARELTVRFVGAAADASE